MEHTDADIISTLHELGADLSWSADRLRNLLREQGFIVSEKRLKRLKAESPATVASWAAGRPSRKPIKTSSMVNAQPGLVDALRTDALTPEQVGLQAAEAHMHDTSQELLLPPAGWPEDEPAPEFYESACVCLAALVLPSHTDLQYRFCCELQQNLSEQWPSRIGHIGTSVDERARALGQVFSDVLRASFAMTCESWLSRLERLHGGKVGFQRHCRLWPCTDKAWGDFLVELGTRSVGHEKIRKGLDQLNAAAVLQEKVRSAAQRATQRETCWECNETSEKLLLLCGGCKFARYCGPTCQRSHWKAGHKHLCSDFRRRRELVDYNYERPPLKHCDEHGLNEHVDFTVLQWAASSPLSGCSRDNFLLHLEAVRRGEWWLYPTPDEQHEKRPFTTKEVESFTKLCNYFAGESDRSRLSPEEFAQQWWAPGEAAPSMTRRFFLQLYECCSIGESEADQVRTKEQFRTKFYECGCELHRRQLSSFISHS